MIHLENIISNIMNTYILEDEIEDIIISYITKEWQILHTKQELALVLYEIQMKRKTFKERAYEHILAVILAFTLWYMIATNVSL